MENRHENEITELLNDISKIQEDNILDQIVSYCDKNDLDIQDVGDQLGSSEQFKRKLYIDLVHNKVIQDKAFSKKESLCEDLDEW